MPQNSDFILAESAVLAAVCYTDIFDFAPKIEELPTYIPLVKLDEASIAAAVQRLCEQQRLFRQEQWITLPSRKDLVALRQERAAIVLERMKQVHTYLPGLMAAPWIKGALLTGSLAAGNPMPDADADLMMILDRRRMWLGYLLTRLWCRKKRPIEFCPNYCVADDALKLMYPNLFTAIEWSMARPLKPGPSLSAMDEENAWCRDMIPNAPLLNEKQVGLTVTKTKTMSLLGWLIYSPLGALLDKIEFMRLKWRTAGAYMPSGHIYKPHPPTRQFHIFKGFLKRLDQNNVAMPELRCHIDDQISSLKLAIKDWEEGVPGSEVKESLENAITTSSSGT